MIITVAIVLAAAPLCYLLFVPVSPDWTAACPPFGTCPISADQSPPLVSLTYRPFGVGGVVIDSSYHFVYFPWGCSSAACSQGAIGGTTVGLLAILLATCFGAGCLVGDYARTRTMVSSTSK